MRNRGTASASLTTKAAITAVDATARSNSTNSACVISTHVRINSLPLLPRPPDAGEGRAPELWSRDAGVFWCNELYYRTLRAVREHLVAPASQPPHERPRRLLPVVFIHLPPLNTSSVEESARFVRAVAERIVRN